MLALLQEGNRGADSLAKTVGRVYEVTRGQKAEQSQTIERWAAGKRFNSGLTGWHGCSQ